VNAYSYDVFAYKHLSQVVQVGVCLAEWGFKITVVTVCTTCFATGELLLLLQSACMFRAGPVICSNDFSTRRITEFSLRCKDVCCKYSLCGRNYPEFVLQRACQGSGGWSLPLTAGHVGYKVLNPDKFILVLW
jgi:hypothetical protein